MDRRLIDFLPEEGESPFENIEKSWHWEEGLPFPKFTPLCIQCKSKEVLIRQWNFRDRANEMGNIKSSNMGRCDVSFKCKICSAVWFHGIVITKEQFEISSSILGEDCDCNYRVVHHREARKILSGHSSNK